jgi:predicted nuclease of predicted toxin-antitoxin system
VKIWVDAQFSPALARWLERELRVEAAALKDLGLRDGGDAEIFFAARSAGGANERLIEIGGRPEQG